MVNNTRAIYTELIAIYNKSIICLIDINKKAISIFIKLIIGLIIINAFFKCPIRDNKKLIPTKNVIDLKNINRVKWLLLFYGTA